MGIEEPWEILEGEVGWIWPKTYINKATLEEAGHMGSSSQHETLGFGPKSLGKRGSE